MKLKWIVGAAAVFVLVVCGIGAIIAFAGAQDPRSGTTLPVSGSEGPGSIVGQEGAKAAKSAVPKRINKPASIGPGMWKVGTDVKPGEYQTSGAVKGVFTLCYWHTAPDTGTSHIQDQGAIDSVDSAGYVTLRKGQYFKTSGCKDWTPVR